MTFKEVLTKIDTLQEQINSFGEIDKEVLKKVHYKFRLDWNYHSNSMEGGTLTREETRSVMTSVLNISNKSIKDLNEMVGHNNIVEEVFLIGKGEKRLSEKRIKEIHKAIIFEENVTKKALLGEWKTENNMAYNYKKEKVSYLPHSEVPELMHTLLNNLNAFFDAYFKGKAKEHPLKVAAQFQIDFLYIHPFHDGNGRVSRILSNLILISCGYPPLIIKTAKKDNYVRLLSDVQVYGGNPELFYAFLGERIIESQEIILKAIKGEDIEDEDDLEKEIELLKRKFVPNTDFKTKSYENILNVYNSSLKVLFEEMDVKIRNSYEYLFVHYNVLVIINGTYFNDNGLMGLDNFMSSCGDNNQNLPNLVRVNYSLRGFKNDGTNTFGLDQLINVEFSEFNYTIFEEIGGKSFFKKLYSESLTESEINEIIRYSIKQLLEKIKRITDK